MLYPLRYYRRLWNPLPRHYRGCDPIAAVLPWLPFPLPRQYRGYRGITAPFSESFPVPAGITAVTAALPR